MSGQGGKRKCKESNREVMAVTQQENKGGFRENQILRIEADGFGKKEKERICSAWRFISP